MENVPCPVDLRLGGCGSHLWPLPSPPLIECGSQCLPPLAHLLIHSPLVLLPLSYRGHQTLVSIPPPANADIVHWRAQFTPILCYVSGEAGTLLELPPAH